jgi:integrase
MADTGEASIRPSSSLLPFEGDRRLRMTEDLERLRERFEHFVDRSGDHHLWIGATRPDTGVGRVKVGGKHLPAPYVAWTLAHGQPADGARVLSCPDVVQCVRVEHLRGPGVTAPKMRPRSAKGGGSVRVIAEGTWELCVTTRTAGAERPKRHFRRVNAPSRREAIGMLASFRAELQDASKANRLPDVNLAFDDAVRKYLVDFLAGDKGREHKTIEDYWRLHQKWFAPALGRRRTRDIELPDLDARFGAMRRAGLSRSRMNQAKSLYMPFFRWAKANRLVDQSPMSDFQLPTSSFVSRERTPPEVAELSLLLNAALEIVPDVAPVLTLGAVTGMRRGELVGVRRERIDWTGGTITVDTAIDAGKRVKHTKTRKERTVAVDEMTLEMLRRHCDAMDLRAETAGAAVPLDGYLFSNAVDCSSPIPPDYVTKRVSVLKDKLGIADKRAETIELEDEALRLFRLPRPPKPQGRTGPDSRGGRSFRQIAANLNRSERWVAMAIASAERREAAHTVGAQLSFDGSILALRKFTSSELLDAGFNISAVAQRQGHGPQVLTKHYAKRRKSADRRAADHLGRVVHQGTTR